MNQLVRNGSTIGRCRLPWNSRSLMKESHRLSSRHRIHRPRNSQYRWRQRMGKLFGLQMAAARSTFVQLQSASHSTRWNRQGSSLTTLEGRPQWKKNFLRPPPLPDEAAAVPEGLLLPAPDEGEEERPDRVAAEPLPEDAVVPELAFWLVPPVPVVVPKDDDGPELLVVPADVPLALGPGVAVVPPDAPLAAVPVDTPF